MLKLKYLLVLTVFSIVTFAEPCKPHRGQPLPWEGSGMCTGNNQLVIPIETTPLSLIHNSIDSYQDYGFGDAAWRLSIDNRLMDERATKSKITLDRGDGSQIEFNIQANGVWTASPVLSKAELYQSRNNFLLEKNPDGSSIYYHLISGNLYGSLIITDSKGNRTTITRNPAGQITKIVDAFGRTITLDYAEGRAISLKDYQGKVYYFSYKENNFHDADDVTMARVITHVLSEVARPDGAGRLISYTIGDSDSDQMEKELYLQSIGIVSKVTEPNGAYTDYWYSDTEETYEDGSYPTHQAILEGSHTFPNDIWRFIAYAEDRVGMGSESQSIGEIFSHGRMILSKENGVTTETVLKTSGPATGLPSIVTNSIGQTTVYDYDANLNVNYIKDENGLVTTTVYDKYNPVLTKTTNGSQLVRMTSYKYINGKVVSIQVPNEEEQLFTRDTKGNVTAVFKDSEQIQSFTYDDKSQMTSQTDTVKGQTTRYSYTNGFLASITDRLGNKTSYVSNALGLPIKIINADGTTQSFDYDELGQKIYESKVGPSGYPLTVTTTRKLGKTMASFSYAKKGTIDASFNMVPLLSKILPWKNAYAEDLQEGASSTATIASNGYRRTVLNYPGPSGDAEQITSIDSEEPSQGPRPPTLAPPIELGKKEEEADTCGKPVIYLYPEKNQIVKVMLDFLGKLDVTYPEYDAKKGWNVEARSDGSLTNLKDGKEYSYLFWEGNLNTPLDIDYTKGFIVEGKDTRRFMQDTLAKMGLTPKEYNEFIVYWYPRLKDNAFNYIHFAGKPYTDSAKLNIIPKPDSMLRVFMAFKPLESATEMKVTPQEFPKFIRKGFVVVEWGGGEVGGPEGMKLGKKIAAGSAMNRME